MFINNLSRWCQWHQHNVTLLGPNKIKVLVLRQRRPLKISADETFLLANRKKIATVPYFWRKQKFKFTAKFKFSSVSVTWTSFDKRLNDWSIENETVKIQHGYEWKHCPRQF
jgi:hypothetical protein